MSCWAVSDACNDLQKCPGCDQCTAFAAHLEQDHSHGVLLPLLLLLLKLAAAVVSAGSRQLQGEPAALRYILRRAQLLDSAQPRQNASSHCDL